MSNTPPFTPTNPQGGFHYGLSIRPTAHGIQTIISFAQRLELRYTGIKDWLFWAKASGKRTTAV